MNRCLRCDKELWDTSPTKYYSRGNFLCRMCISDMVDHPEEEKIYRDKYRLYRKKLKKYSCNNILKPTPSASGAEAILQKIVQNIFFFKLSKEVVFEPYIIDFVISHASVKIGIEIDGSVHDRQQNYDDERDQILLQKYALPIYRFANNDVYTSNFVKSVWASCYKIYEVRIAQVNSIANKYDIAQMQVKI